MFCFNAFSNQLPTGSIIARLVQIRTVIAHFVARPRNITYRRILIRRFNAVDHHPLGKFFRGYIGPVFPTILSQMNQAIITSYPQQTFLQWGFIRGKESTIIFYPRIVLRNRPPRGAQLRRIVSCQIGTDHLPALPFVFT